MNYGYQLIKTRLRESGTVVKSFARQAQLCLIAVLFATTSGEVILIRTKLRESDTVLCFLLGKHLFD